MNVTTNDCTMATGVIQTGAAWSDCGATASIAAEAQQVPLPQPLHRLSEVRQREGLTLDTVAHRLRISVREAEKLEQPGCDMPLSELYRWHKALRVPVDELLHEPDEELAPSVQWRAQLLRAMKTVHSIEERAKQPAVRRMANTLAALLAEIMPELKDIGAWPAVGRRRPQTELGQAYYRRITPESLGMLDLPEE